MDAPMPRRAGRRARAGHAEFKSGAEVCEKSDTDSDNKKFKNRAAPGAVGAGAGDFDFCVWGRGARGRRGATLPARRAAHHNHHAPCIQ